MHINEPEFVVCLNTQNLQNAKILSVINLFREYYVLLFVFFFKYQHFILFWLHCMAYQILMSRPGVESGPSAVRALTTGPQGNSLFSFLKTLIMYIYM